MSDESRQRGFSLYVHIPFCDVRCPYCHFYCFVNRDPSLPLRYVKGLATELRLQLDTGQFEPPLRSVYFGGGTPTALSPAARNEACRWLAEELSPLLAEDAEITLEANPESSWPESLAPWVAAGVNRISLGIQSMDVETLRFLGRLNTPASNRRALELACRLVDNVSIDLIIATPGSDWPSTRHSLEQLLAGPVDHVSAYLLEVHKGTRFGREVRDGRWKETPDDAQAELYLRMVEWLDRRGFVHYEVSNFAQAGRESRHNQAYWEGTSYLGLGPSAHSFDAHRRRWNLSDARHWCESLERGVLPPFEDEELGEVERRDEELLLGLRTRRGVSRSWLAGNEALWAAWVAAGLAQSQGQRLRLTPKGWLIMDQIVERLSESSRQRRGNVGRPVG